MGAEELQADARFGDIISRVVNRDALQWALEAKRATAPTAIWEKRLLAQGIPCGPLNTIDKALADPQIKAPGHLQTIDGESYLGSPLHTSATPPGLRRGTAEIGEHAREVLLEVGLDETEITRLIALGAVAQAPPKPA
jgi:formyl-CoA transferase